MTIAVGRAFKPLVKAGIIPDFTIFADAVKCLEQIQGVEDFFEKTNSVLLSKADYQLFRIKSKSKILYFSETDSMAKYFEKAGSVNPGFYKSGGSVSIISYYFAKTLGFGQIVFSGLDLAFIDNKIFADGQNIENVAEHLKHKIINVKNKDGNDVLTRADYAWFIRQFNEIFTEEINLARIINTSLKGAFINGMEYMAFTEFAKTLSEVKPDIDEIISSVYADTKKNWNSALLKVYSKLKQVKDDIEELNKASTEIYFEFNKICEELANFGKTNYTPEAFDILNNKSIETRQKIIDNPILFFALKLTEKDYQ